MQDVLRQLLSITRSLWRFRWPGLVMAWVVAVIGSIVVLRMPDIYEGSARIFVDTDSILKPLMSGLTVQPNVEQQLGMLSRTLISRPNLEKLVRLADLDLKSGSKAELDAVVDRLQKDIVIRPATGVNLYALSYRDTDPERAKRVVQSLVSIFVESGLGANRKGADSAKAFLDEQIKVFEAKLEDAETKLKDFRIRNLDRQGADGRDSATRVAEATAQLESARLQLREAERARDAARRQLAEARGQAPSSALPDLLRSAPASASSIQVSTPEIDARIDAQQRALDGLLQRYTEQHPDVISTQRLIADLKVQKQREVEELRKRAIAAAANAPAQPAGGEQLAAQEMQRMLATAEVQVAAMQARAEEFAERLSKLRDQMRTAPQLEAEAAQLNRDYEVTRRNYEDLVSRRQAALLTGEMEGASGVAEFRLIDPPRAGSEPVAPNRAMLFPLVLVAAVGAGLALAFVLAQLRPTLGDGDEVRAATQLPLLGVVTAVLSEVDLRRQRADALRFAGASAGLLVLMVAGLALLSLMRRGGL